MARGRPSKKQQILDTALGLFAELGYQGTSVDMVVQRAGVSKPTVYNNFPTKLDLWQAALRQLLEGADEARRQLCGSSGSDGLGRILMVFAELGQNPQLRTIYRIMLGEQHKMDAATGELFVAWERDLKCWCEQQLREDGHDVSRTQMFALIAFCREGLLFPALSGAPVAPADELRKMIESL